MVLFTAQRLIISLHNENPRKQGLVLTIGEKILQVMLIVLKSVFHSTKILPKKVTLAQHFTLHSLMTRDTRSVLSTWYMLGV